MQDLAHLFADRQDVSKSNHFVAKPKTHVGVLETVLYMIN